MEESFEHTQIAAPPSLVGVWPQQDPIVADLESMISNQSPALHDAHLKASRRFRYVDAGNDFEVAFVAIHWQARDHISSYSGSVKHSAIDGKC